MNLKDPLKWNFRVSALYALGVWTMLGSLAYYEYTGRFDDTAGKQEVKEPENPNKHVYKTGHFTSVVIYKEDFVPYSSRIYNFLKGFSGKAGPGDGSK